MIATLRAASDMSTYLYARLVAPKVKRTSNVLQQYRLVGRATTQFMSKFLTLMFCDFG